MTVTDYSAERIVVKLPRLTPGTVRGFNIAHATGSGRCIDQPVAFTDTLKMHQRWACAITVAAIRLACVKLSIVSAQLATRGSLENRREKTHYEQRVRGCLIHRRRSRCE